jgi:hypothetical protein
MEMIITKEYERNVRNEKARPKDARLLDWQENFVQVFTYSSVKINSLIQEQHWTIRLIVGTKYGKWHNTGHSHENHKNNQIAVTT